MREEANIRQDYFIAAALTLAAIVTRSYGLSSWDFLVDEFATVAYAEERMTSLMNPAYYALAWLGFEAFGVSELTARFPAMLFGVAAVPIFYLTWRTVFGRYAAALGAVFILLSSWHLWFSQFSRFYTAVFFFGSLAYYCYWKAVEKDDLRALLLALLLSVVAVLFHFTAVFVAASCAVFSIVILILRRFGFEGSSPRVAWIHVSICLLAGLGLTPFLLGMLDTWQSRPQSWGSGPATLVIQIAKYIQLPLCAAAGLGALQMYRAGMFRQLFILTGIGIPIICLIVLSTFTTVRPDYIFYALPLICLSAGYLCSVVAEVFEHRTLMAHAISVVLAVSLVPEFVSHYTGHGSLDIRDTVAYIESRYQPGDTILPLVSGFDYYAGEDLEVEDRPGLPYDKSRDWPSLMDAYASRPGRMWIILPSKRKLFATGLRNWLGENASIVWRKYETRYDYTFRGYEIYMVRRSD